LRLPPPLVMGPRHVVDYASMRSGIWWRTIRVRATRPPAASRTLGHLAGIDEAVSAPSDTGEPGSRWADGRWPGADGRPSLAKAREPSCRRAWVDLGHRPQMLAEVHQDVDQSVTYRARRGQRTRMIAVGEHAPTPGKRAVHGACEPDRQPADAARKCATVVRLGDEVDVVILDAEFDDPEPGLGRGSDRAAHGGKDSLCPEAVNGVDCPHRDVHGVRGGVPWPSTVRHPGTTTGGELPSCAGSATTPSRRGRQGQLGRTCHDLDRANITFYLTCVK